MGLFEQCKELYADLSSSSQRLLTLMISAPCAETWIEARKLVICSEPLLTLEMAVKRVSNKSIKEIPDSFTIYRALRYAAERSQLAASQNFSNNKAS